MMRTTLSAIILATIGALSACQSAEPDVPIGPNLSVILADAPAPKLADYGLFIDAAATRPAERVKSYELINPLFSDHAEKTRLVFVPKGEAAVYTDVDVLSLPVGSVLIKSFGYAETGRIETRLLIHKSAGWVGYPYIWDEEGTEARYAPIGGKRPVAITAPDGEPIEFTYAVPNQNQCKTCHQFGDTITPIGPKARNLGAIQLASWRDEAFLTGLPETVAAMPSIMAGEGTLEMRGRAYLDINCAHCHKASGGASNSGLWLGWDEQQSVRLGLGKHPTAAGRGAGALTRIIEPGDASRSILAYRMASDEAGIAMPELGRRLIDRAGVALIEDWINEMEVTTEK